MKAFLDIPLRILTHNIRFATTSPEKGEELWSVRAPGLINELRWHMRHVPASIICLQEVLHEQVFDIMKTINGGDKHRVENYGQQRPMREPERLKRLSTPSPKWTFMGCGRDDGKTAGEYSPILYRHDIWHLKRYETFWLSETPSKPSKSWGAGSIRIITIGVLEHKAIGLQIIVMNTHLDDQSNLARKNAAKQILDYVDLYRKNTTYSDVPIFLAGDFNSEVDGEAYKIITSKDSPLLDVRGSVPANQRYGDVNTYTGFNHAEKQQRIDFVFSEAGRLVEGYGVLPNKFEDGVFISDHRAVIADFTLHVS
jgi:endonuclease/exonuclease/phosphatase family metal-dependent hydrolase